MRTLERQAIQSGRVSGLDLMERAGQGVVEAVFDTWRTFDRTGRGPAPAPPEFSGPSETGATRAIILCGPGNNGGDGFVVARLLAVRGWAVDVLVLGDAARLPPDARSNYERWLEIGRVTAIDGNQVDLSRVCADLAGASLVVDAIFGLGNARDVPPFVKTLSQALESCRFEDQHIRVVAIDIPSGLDADTGHIWGAALQADLTVTFHRPKHGHVLQDGPSHCGKLVVKDIGL